MRDTAVTLPSVLTRCSSSTQAAGHQPVDLSLRAATATSTSERGPTALQSTPPATSEHDAHSIPELEAGDGTTAAVPPRPSAVTLATAASSESEGGALVVATSLLAAPTPLGHVQLSHQVDASAATSSADDGVSATPGGITAGQAPAFSVPVLPSAKARHVGGTRFMTQVGH
jgi:hypothetical protein